MCFRSPGKWQVLISVLTRFCLGWQVHLEGLWLPEEHSQRHNEAQNIFEYSTGKCAAMHALGLESGGDPGSVWIIQSGHGIKT